MAEPDGDSRPDVMHALRATVAALDLSEHDVWLAYFALGGDGSRAAVAGWLVDAVPRPADYSVLATAVNEILFDVGLERDVPSALEPGS